MAISRPIGFFISNRNGLSLGYLKNPIETNAIYWKFFKT